MWFMLGAQCELCLLVSGLNSLSLPVLMGVSALHVIQNISFNQSCWVWVCLHGWPSSKAVNRGEGLLECIFPVILHPRTLLWSVSNCLWKNRRQTLLPSVSCVVLTVQYGPGMLAINIQLWPNSGAKLKSHLLRRFSAVFGRTHVSALLISLRSVCTLLLSKLIHKTKALLSRPAFPASGENHSSVLELPFHTAINKLVGVLSERMEWF